MQKHIKNIVITGTSRGIGLELLRQLSDQGHRILSLTRKATEVSDRNFQGVTSMKFDLEGDSGFEQVQQFLKNDWGHVDVLINNAGLFHKDSFENITLAQWERVFRVNVFGAARLTQCCLPFMKQGGHVVNISSMGGVQGSVKFPGLSAYSSSKGALITLTELLAEEYKEQGIHFNVIALGAVQTEMLEAAFPGFQAPVTASQAASYIANFALEQGVYFNGKLIQMSSSTP